MGQAKIKREKEEARRREERERQRALRPRAYGGARIRNVPDPDKPQKLLGDFERHVDGKLYLIVTRTEKGGRRVDTGQRRRVKNQEAIDYILAYAEARAKKQDPAAAAVA
jgi:hypothetical protein